MAPTNALARARGSASSSRRETSSVASDKQKPKRASKPKVKTGCRNCKDRRIKCDEKRPSCSQCERSKKVCTGYPPPARSSRTHDILIAPRPQVLAARPLQQAQPPHQQQQQQIRPHALAPVAQQHQLNPWPQGHSPPHTPMAPTNTIMIYQPSAGLPFSEQDGLYFSLFRSHTANELSGFFDNVFWSRIVMQECHSEPAIRHAVVALGALYKTLEKATESPPSSPTDSGLLMDSAHRHWEVALKQYSKALEASISASRQDVGAHRTVLMASVLLACFDSFVGDHKKAILQIQQGLRFLESLRAERRRSFAPKPEEPVEDEIIQMFTRLAIQAKSYDMAFHFPQPHVIRLLPSPTDPLSPGTEGTSPVSIHQEPIPPQFPSLLDARIAWDTLLERVFRFTELMFQFVSAGSAPNILPHSMTQYGQQFQADLRAWSDAFEPLLSSRFAPSVTRQEKAGIAVLKMFHLMGEILFAMTFSDSEMHFDKFRPHFKTIVDLAQEVVGDEERSAKEKRCPNPGLCTHQRNHPPDVFGGNDYAAHHIKASFSADLGIVPPLYVVATKSRDRQIRRQAIQLLRSSSRREGMWDSELMARIGMWVTEIEEEEELLTPRESPVAFSRPFSDAGSPNGSLDFGERPLGPGGNARWEDRRESIVSTLSNRSQPKPIPAEKRVLVKSCEFDLREHKAVLQCGTRGLAAGSLDLKTRRTTISW